MEVAAVGRETGGLRFEQVQRGSKGEILSETGQGGGVVAGGAVLLDDGTQVGPPVKGGLADPGADGYFGERDGLPGGGQLGAGGLDPGLLVAVSWHGPGR
jgi:hypothetical protein